MKEKQIKVMMVSLILLGLVLVLVGLYLAIFTNISISKGTDGILTIAGFIAGGLFISVPAKIYLTLQMMRSNDEHLGAINGIKKNL